MEASAALVEATKEMAGPGGCVSGDIIDTLRHHGVLGLWEQTHLAGIRDRLAHKLLPQLGEAAEGQTEEDNEDVEGGLAFSTAIGVVAQEMAEVQAAARKFDETVGGRNHLRGRVCDLLESEILHSSHDKIRKQCIARLRTGFSDFSELAELRDDDDDLDAALSSGDLRTEVDHPEAMALLARLRTFQQLAVDLQKMGLLDMLITTPDFHELLHSVVCARITDSCEGVFDEEFLPSLSEWLDDVVKGWLTLMRPDSPLDSKATSVTQCIAEMHSNARFELCTLRITELFDIIVDFPDSQPAVGDLRNCLARTDQRALLLSSLKAAFRKRLLHPGANTTDILAQYILAIKALRELDPTGVILEVVCRPVRSYLQSREDTVRSIVRSLVDDSNTELSSELAEGKPINMPDSDMSSDEEGDDSWMPDPIDADPTSSRSQRTGDITSVLINIYGSKELFVKEYRLLLSERLLALPDYNVDKEARYLELLKLRFGEEHMTQCDVMLKDISDSKRISSRIHEDLQGAESQADMAATGDLRIFILSRLFWPTLKGEDTLQLPSPVQKSLDTFTAKFETLKAARTLDFKNHLGLVNLELTLDSGATVDFSVPPIVATIMFHFEERSDWNLEQLSSVMKVPTPTIQKRMTFWIRSGLIRATAPGEYILDEQGYVDRSNSAGGAGDHVDDEDDAEDEDEDEELYWQFIQGMLANHASLPLDRIYALLSMFVEGGLTLTEPALQKFLAAKVDTRLLVMTQGEYALPNDD